MGRSVHYTSPSTRIRNIRRLIKYLSQKISKPPCLAIDIKPSISERKLSIQKIVLVDVPPKKKYQKLGFTQPTVCSFPLILPKPSFHPNIVEASKLIYGKRPIDLTQEERIHFLGYQEYKLRNGLSIEDDFVYKPREDP